MEENYYILPQDYLNLSHWSIHHTLKQTQQTFQVFIASMHSLLRFRSTISRVGLTRPRAGRRMCCRQPRTFWRHPQALLQQPWSRAQLKIPLLGDIWAFLFCLGTQKAWQKTPLHICRPFRLFSRRQPIAEDDNQLNVSYFLCQQIIGFHRHATLFLRFHQQPCQLPKTPKTP